MTRLTRVLGAAALVGVGWSLGRSRTRWELAPLAAAYRYLLTERADHLEQIAYLAGQLEEVEREHLEAAPRLWQRGFEAGQHLNELQLARTKVERDERSRAAWN